MKKAAKLPLFVAAIGVGSSADRVRRAISVLYAGEKYAYDTPMPGCDAK